jgi:uncharacterized lipoprotein YmbA
MPRIFARLLMVIATMIALSTIGCGGSKPARFYLLQAEPSDRPAAPGGDAGELTLIGMMPVVLPDYLMRPQIASHAQGNRLDYAEYDRWAEPLPDTILRLVSHDLGLALPGHRVVAHPWLANVDIRFRLRLECQQFDLYEDGAAVLKAVWAIGMGRTGQWVKYGSLDLTETFAEDKKPDYSARVAALNRLVVKMNQQLADAVRAFLQARANGQGG